MWSRRLRLGVVIAPDTVALSLCTAGGRRMHHDARPCQVDLRDAKLDGITAPLAEMVAQFPAAIKRADTHVAVALPDPLFQQTMLHFEDFPKRMPEAAALVGWRHCADLDLDQTATCVGFEQRATAPKGPTSVLAQSAAKALTDDVQRLLWQVALVPSRIDSTMSYLNAATPRNQSKSARAVLWYADHWWSFRIIGQGGAREPQFAAWGGLAQGGDTIVRRLKRVMAAANKTAQTAPTTLEVYSHGTPCPSVVERLSNDPSIAVVDTRLASWTALADVVAEVRK